MGLKANSPQKEKGRTTFSIIPQDFYVLLSNSVPTNIKIIRHTKHTKLLHLYNSNTQSQRLTKNANTTESFIRRELLTFPKTNHTHKVKILNTLQSIPPFLTQTILPNTLNNHSPPIKQVYKTPLKSSEIQV